MAGFSSIKIEWHTRECEVNGELGYFHTWEHWSRPVESSPLIGGAPAGVISKVFGIVEFKDGIRRVNPEDIKFCDDDHDQLCDWIDAMKDLKKLDIDCEQI